MIERDVDLVSYLPPFLSEFKENTIALEAENPEFALAWDAQARVLKNEFIETADEYGISRFEKMLGIVPQAEDTLESRRVVVKSRWFNGIPYTMRVLLERLIELCGDGGFTVEKKFEQYEIKVHTVLPVGERLNEVKHLLEYMLPANMIRDIIQESILEIDETGLEQFNLVRFTFRIRVPEFDLNPYGITAEIADRLKIPFWNWRTFNGEDDFDGTWFWDAIRVYRLGVGTTQGYTVGNNPPGVAAVIFISPKIINAERLDTKNEIKAIASVSGGDSIENVTVETFTSNYWYFDGSQKFNGSRKFNSYYRKEDVE